MPEPMTDAYRANARPYLYGDEREHLLLALDSGQYGHGEITEQFERAVADHLGVPDLVAVSTGTDALEIALTAAGIGRGDEVVVPSMTFCSTIQAVIAAGARPRFAEVDPQTLCVTDETIMEAVTDQTTAVMPVLYGGRAVDLRSIHDELAEHGITVVEDAAQAFGSHEGNVPVGATGVLTCFSFGPIKSLTCGQGGAIVPRNEAEATAARQMRLVGMAESPAERARSTSYRVERVGIRAHMSQLNAAIGLAQLAHFEKTRAVRKELWRSYAAALADVPGVQLVNCDVERTVPSMCVVLVNERDRVYEALRAKGIGVGAHYPPNHRQPAFSDWFRPLPVTEDIGRRVLTLPFHQHMALGDAQIVAEALEAAL
ncbi:DegT/DnrJ/EryC1/StrS family aminotransferase [Streptomyces lavendulocolor]|uniref:DegT/DnrJ/EryC1/StrS family aminotransferase n=1 Tax=Streptomyces lavendulocolor TaxID=67316 RepID=UPI0033E598EE